MLQTLNLGDRARAGWSEPVFAKNVESRAHTRLANNVVPHRPADRIALGSLTIRANGPRLIHWRLAAKQTEASSNVNANVEICRIRWKAIQMLCRHFQIASTGCTIWSHLPHYRRCTHMIHCGNLSTNYMLERANFVCETRTSGELFLFASKKPVVLVEGSELPLSSSHDGTHTQKTISAGLCALARRFAVS